MRDTQFTVVRTASTPTEAKVLVALLQAEGIPAFLDGDSLADEIAVSRRVMNLNGVQVRVAAQCLDAAREILANAKVDEAELTAQALAAAPADEVPPPTVPPRPARPRGIGMALALLLCAAAAATFFALWRGEVEWREGYTAFARRQGASNLQNIEPTADGWRQLDAKTGAVELQGFDRNGDGNAEAVLRYSASGQVNRIARDVDEDGCPEEVEEVHADDIRVVWRDTDGDRLFDSNTVLDQGGTVIRRQHWDGKNGFVDVR